jgi:aspartate/tyrosine/aromatic aminotransferase
LASFGLGLVVLVFTLLAAPQAPAILRSKASCAKERFFMFERLTMAPPDPILGLTEAFKKDPNPAKINLGVGIYLDEDGKAPTLATVREAARRLAEAAPDPSYLPIVGLPEYNDRVQRVVLGEEHPVLAEGRVVTAQTPGGTGALRVAADFVKHAGRANPTIWISDETWVNHVGVFGAAGFEIRRYPYYDPKTQGLRLDAMLKAIAGIPRGDVILLQGVCHNPTGIDPTTEQWNRIAEAVSMQGLLPLIDFAYQGLAQGLEEDAYSVRLFAQLGHEAIVASSFSKNFSLYNERVGAVTLIGSTADAAQHALSHVKVAIRSNYSNPPRHGGALVATVLGDPALRAQWEQEVAGIRERIHAMRSLLAQALADRQVPGDFSSITRQYGLFSYSGLTPRQVDALRERHSIYVVRNGRINVAGITRHNIDRMADALADVLKNN